jgi:hypothetical protein
MDICERLENINNQLPDSTILIAVSKTHPEEVIARAYQCGCRYFGENKVQDLVAKQSTLPKDIQWHMIGHLQRNKVKDIAPFVAMIHAVDSLRLLIEIDKQAEKNNRIIPCLFQFHIAEEDTKFGLNLSEAIELIEAPEFKQCKHVDICGVMGMASFTDNENVVREEFRKLKTYFNVLKSRYFIQNNSFKEISMGMSSDWQIAVQEGSTMIRVGTSIFGVRSYQ